MEYVYGALLLHAAGQKVDEAGMKKVLDAASVKSDAARIKAVVSSLEGVDIEEAIKNAAVAAAPAAAPAAGEEKKEEKKDEKKEEAAAEEAAAGLGSLFG
jgi:large subunit ribosomal protein L12